MSSESGDIRQQILANSKVLLLGNTLPSHGPLPSMDSAMTLSPTISGKGSCPENLGGLEIVVFGEGNKFTGAVMLGVTPAIEGGTGSSPEAAVRKLLLATCELLHDNMPKLGGHQRAIHGGGVFDEDLINPEFKKAAAKAG